MNLHDDPSSMQDKIEPLMKSLPESLKDYIRIDQDKLSNASKDSYRRRWNQQISNRPEELFNDKVHALALWITHSYETGEYNYSTFRQFKAAFCFGLSTIFDDEGLVKAEFDDLVNGYDYYNGLYVYIRNYKLKKQSVGAVATNNGDPLDSGSGNVIEGGGNDTVNKSVSKDMKFSHEIYHWIMRIDSTGKRALDLLQKFLKANLLLGLRPEEWLDVRMATNIETMTPSLVITNSKDSDERADGSTRTIILTDATLDEKCAILNFIEAFNVELQNDFEKFKMKCEDYYAKDPKDKTGVRALGQKEIERLHGKGKTWNPVYRDVPIEHLVDIYDNLQSEFASMRLLNIQTTLYRILKDFPHYKLDNKLRPTLLSTRHQVFANAKQNNVPVLEIAAFFGYSSLNAVRRHRANAGVGWGKFKFKPDPESVRLVEEQNRKNVDTSAQTQNRELSLAELYKDW